VGKGSQRNEQKINTRRAEEAKETLRLAREKLRELLAIPSVRRDEEILKKIEEQRGILKRAIAKGLKSETHSRKGKASRR
jgi:hypothetical protein